MDLDSIEKIKKYLVSKDFYEYKFSNELGDFVRELCGLANKTKLRSILGENPKTTQKNKEFYKKYKESAGFTYLSDLIENKKYIDKDQCLNQEVKEIIRKNINPEFWGRVQLFDYSILQFADRHTILSKMNQRICPYCNMNYTFSYTDNGEKKSIADLDHFYLQSIYPEYSLCLYNFIPACPVCNSRLKGMTNMSREKYIFPHEDSFEGKAKFEISNLGNVMLNDLDVDINFNVYNDTDGRVEESINAFKLEKLYQQQCNEVKEILEKVLIYNESYMEELSEIGIWGEEPQKIKRMVFGEQMTEADIGRVSLGKLKRDILRQLRIF